MAYADPTRPRRWRLIVALLLLILPGLWFAVRVPDVPAPQARAKYHNDASSFFTAEPGLSIHFRDEGPRGALPVLLLHGSNASLQTWEPWVARLKGRYRVITYDLPGHGLTGPYPNRDYSPERAERIVLDLAKARGLTRFVIGGNSMGGGIAARFAAKHPDRIAGLILVDASGMPFRDKGGEPLSWRIARTPLIRNIAEQVTPRAMVASTLRQSFGDPSKVTDAMIDRYWELLRYPGNREATIDRFSTKYAPLDAEQLHRFTAPVAIVWGDTDRIIPPASAAWFKRIMPQASLTILDGVGHVPMEEAPDAALAPVLTMLAGISAQGVPPPLTAAR